MTEPRFVISYWLLPAEPLRAFFRETIERLAAKYDGPVFDPHLTLAVGPDSPAEIGRILEQLTHGPIELRVGEVAFSSKFTRTLFIRFAASAPLFRLRASLGATEDDDFDPHLSLLYKKIPEAEQRGLAAEFKLSFATVIFDSIAAMRCRIPVLSAAEVEVWEPVAARKL